MRILAIDPGKIKCGIAVVEKESGLIKKSVILTENISEKLIELINDTNPDIIVLGGGTFCKKIRDKIKGLLSLPLEIVDEKESTRKAKLRYFLKHPPRGWRRFIPLLWQTPPEAYDDYAAWILAEEYLGRLRNF